jgi:hypothetical protein
MIEECGQLGSLHVSPHGEESHCELAHLESARVLLAEPRPLIAARDNLSLRRQGGEHRCASAYSA